MTTQDLKSFLIDLLKFSPLGLGYWFLCYKGIIPREYSLSIALISGYIIGFATALIQDFIERRSQDGH